ncbi:transposase [Salmonella enterica subsp. enterica serovar Braenderup]|nr:transposase [Salmonella enterica subsp. enterica serovar Braenderup]
MMLNVFAGVCDDKYPQISKSRRAHWENLNTFFRYLPDIRQAIYTTNAIESLNSVIRAEIINARYSRETTQCGRLFIWRSKMSQKSGVCRSSTGGWQ